MRYPNVRIKREHELVTGVALVRETVEEELKIVCTKPSPTCDFYGLLGRDNMQIIDFSEPNM